MAGSQLPQPLLRLWCCLLALALLLKSGGSSGTTSVTSTGVAVSETEDLASNPLTSPSSHPSPTSVENLNSQESTERGSILHPSTPSSEADSITPSNSEATFTMQPTSSQAETVTHSSSGSPSSEHTLTSHSSPLSSISLTTLRRSPTHPNPSTVPSFVSSATTDGTSVASDLGDTGAPELHRNPGVVVAVCLLVSVLLIGCVIMAVRCCHTGVSEFQKLDEGLVSQRSSSAYHTLE
ncbi:mucin-3A-like [Balaenoptera musculus]|uniref:Mucin-3A-like n=1 Tax=Balaenoptera musculus TaxID=9771 RepID=A0A8B8WVG0_BALMU|nr:mucin-3A-like [Balaenoptera musculus]